MKKSYLKNHFLNAALKVMSLCFLALLTMVFFGGKEIIQADGAGREKERFIREDKTGCEKDMSGALEQEKSYKIYADKDIAEVMETVSIHWEENTSVPEYLVAEYEGKPVWKMEVKEGLNSINLAFDREGMWRLYFLLREDGGLRSGKGEEGSLDLLITKEEDFLCKWNIKKIKYGKEMIYFKWDEEFDGVEISVSDKRNGTYRELGSIEGKGFWLKAEKGEYIKLCPYVILNNNKHYGQSRVIKFTP